MNTIIKRIKEEQKALAKDIRGLKDVRKPLRDEDGKVRIDKTGTYERMYYKDYEVQAPINFRFSDFNKYGNDYTLKCCKYEYRHRHIAYCELIKGRSLSEIEPKTNKELDTKYIDHFKKIWENELFEDYTQKLKNGEYVSEYITNKWKHKLEMVG